MQSTTDGIPRPTVRVAMNRSTNRFQASTQTNVARRVQASSQMTLQTTRQESNGMGAGGLRVRRRKLLASPDKQSMPRSHAEKQLGCGELNAFVNSDPTTAVEDSSPPSHPRRLHCDPPRPMQEMPGRRPRARRPRNCSTQSGVGQGADDGNRNVRSRHRRRHSPDEKQDLQIQRGITPENPQQQQQTVRHRDQGHNGMKLRLDLNLEVEVTLKASIHGDLTLALLYVGSCDPTALVRVPTFCPRPSSTVRGFPFQAVKTPHGRTDNNRWGGTLLTTFQ